MTELAKLAKLFYSKCDFDLALIYEVIQRGSSNILTGLYECFIWLEPLDTMKISSESDVRLPRYCKFPNFPLGCFYPPPFWFFTCGDNLVPTIWVFTVNWTIQCRREG